jgi:hypothetical protein
MKSNITNLIYIDTVEAYTLIQNDFDNVTDFLITNNPLWYAKKTKVKFLVEKYLCGPAGNSGLRAANFIDKYIGNYNDKI